MTLVDRHNHHVFQPLLYQVATAGLSPGDIASPIRWVLRRQPNVRVLLGEAQAIDVAARRVSLDGGESLAYDYLIVAAGATHAYFGHPEWAPFAPGTEDARRRAAGAAADAAGVRSGRAGGGPGAQRSGCSRSSSSAAGRPGVELAGALAEIARQTLRDEFQSIDTRRSRIVLVEAGPCILSTFPRETRNAARRSLQRLGVEVREKTRGHARRARDVRLGDERIEAGTMHVGRRRGGLAAGQDARCAARSRRPRPGAEPDLTIPGHPEVFVVGDLASLTDANGVPYAGRRAGGDAGRRQAARNILRAIARRGAAPFVYKNLGNMAIVGRASAIADLGWMRLSGLLGWLAWLFLHIVKLIGFRNRIVVLVEWAVAYITYQRSVRLITGNLSRKDI